LGNLKPICIAGGSKSLFIVTQEGKVHACGEGTNGRLGLSHSSNVSAPRQMSALSQYVVKKVAVHSGGKHAMALTVDGKVFSWVSEFLRFFLYLRFLLIIVWRKICLARSSSSKILQFLCLHHVKVNIAEGTFLKGLCAFICLSSGCFPILPIDGAAIAFCWKVEVSACSLQTNES
jgi:hypothetical protein